jgi:hypothetical protein
VRKKLLQVTALRFALLLFISIAGVGIGGNYSHVLAAQTRGYTPCQSTIWVTKGLADDYEQGFHLHVQLQGLMDQQNTSQYCGKAVGNAFLDEPTGAPGVLEVYADNGRSPLAGGILDGLYEDAKCNVPTQCPLLGSDSGRGSSSFEAGGSNYAFTLAADTPITHFSNTIRVCADFTQQNSDGSTQNTAGGCTGMWLTDPNSTTYLEA